MRDDDLDLPGRNTLEIGLGDRVHQGFLDAGILSKDLGLEGFLTKLRFPQRDIPEPGHERTILGTVPIAEP